MHWSAKRCSQTGSSIVTSQLQGLAKFLTRHFRHHLPHQGRVVALGGLALVVARRLGVSARVALLGRLLAFVQGRAGRLSGPGAALVITIGRDAPVSASWSRGWCSFFNGG